jgi:hypothetical protein
MVIFTLIGKIKYNLSTCILLAAMFGLLMKRCRSCRREERYVTPDTVIFWHPMRLKFCKEVNWATTFIPWFVIESRLTKLSSLSRVRLLSEFSSPTKKVNECVELVSFVIYVIWSNFFDSRSILIFFYQCH